jgi:hypothetical protein
MITSNAEGVYKVDGKHTAPPGHDNKSACRPVSRHNRLIASRAASVTTRRLPRRSTRSQEPRERCTVIACQHRRYSHHNPARETPLARKQSAQLIARDRRSPPHNSRCQPQVVEQPAALTRARRGLGPCVDLHRQPVDYVRSDSSPRSIRGGAKSYESLIRVHIRPVLGELPLTILVRKSRDRGAVLLRATPLPGAPRRPQADRPQSRRRARRLR